MHRCQGHTGCYLLPCNPPLDDDCSTTASLDSSVQAVAVTAVAALHTREYGHARRANYAVLQVLSNSIE